MNCSLLIRRQYGAWFSLECQSFEQLVPSVPSMKRLRRTRREKPLPGLRDNESLLPRSIRPLNAKPLDSARWILWIFGIFQAFAGARGMPDLSYWKSEDWQNQLAGRHREFAIFSRKKVAGRN
jgi:hypothetical protein